jgi:hypothetical protein
MSRDDVFERDVGVKSSKRCLKVNNGDVPKKLKFPIK